jgi:hypothetical protein
MAMLDRQNVNENLLFCEREKARPFYGSIRKLEALSLIMREKESANYSIHRYTQYFILQQLQQQGMLEAQQQQATKLLSERYPFSDQTWWRTCQVLDPHALKVLDYSFKEPPHQYLWSKANIAQKHGIVSREARQI